MKMIADMNEQYEKPYLYSESRSMQQKSQSLSKNLKYHKKFHSFFKVWNGKPNNTQDNNSNFGTLCLYKGAIRDLEATMVY